MRTTTALPKSIIAALRYLTERMAVATVIARET